MYAHQYNMPFYTHVLYFKLQVVAFNDISAQAPVHVLIIPRKPITRLSTSEDADEQVCFYFAEQLLLQGLIYVVLCITFLYRFWDVCYQ